MLERNHFQSEPSNEILASRIAQHDIAALEIIYDRFASRVFSLAAMLSECTEAERIVLQVFTRLWSEIDQFILQSGVFQDWLLDLTRAHILSGLKGHKKQTTENVIAAINRWLSEATNQGSEIGLSDYLGKSDIILFFVREYG